ncbi:transcriptional regulator, MarR family [Nocardioides terrae]|uniref:Transcriptional regulator, MarR family n=1 Tax=Nocardioides terrae TaxID=574651 RepID=A0A1I1KV68_9ACTN|nr:MarR family transcriptional regulator [Nocardioides terrae]SFC64696.1 transcriptional regulator, MarR family [Nocardioides terrae]
MAEPDQDPQADARDVEQIDAVMMALQALVGIAAQSITQVEDQVTLPQLRVLVLIASRGTLNLNALAEAMNVHPSNASRSCDRLVAAGLLSRTESPLDRRHLILGLTDQGRELIGTLVEHRRVAIGHVLERVPESRRRALVNAMRAFGKAAGESSAGEAWKMGWHR